MIWLLMNLALAEILLLSQDLTKDAASELTTQCELLLDQRQLRDLEIRSSRFYVTGKGYQYRVVIAGLKDKPQAIELQEHLLTESIQVTLQIDGHTEQQNIQPEVEVIPETVVKVAEPEVVEEVKSQSQVEERIRQREKPSVDDVLLHAERAHKVLHQNWLLASQEQFYFYRRLPQEGSNIHHRYYQQGNNLRLDITIKNGEGVNSTTVLPEDGEAWIRSADKVVPRNATRTKELLSRFSSKNILAVPFHFSEDVGNSDDWNQFTSVKKDGDLWTLSGASDNVLTKASFYRDNWLIAMIEVRNGGRTMTYEFTDYREIKNFGFIPHVVQIFDEEQLVEEIQIEELTFADAIPDSMFSRKDQH